MAALVEYPEAKSVLEDHAKKRMKTNLQAQRAFSVDSLMRNSHESSSVDSGIVTKDENQGQEVSEIKAMIEDLKNASRVPGRTIWQLIARCEVLQSKLVDKEKEVEDSKQRIKDLEQLLFSHHYPKYEEETIECTEKSEGNSDESSPKCLKPVNKVVKQYSQDEGRRIKRESSNSSMEETGKNDSRMIPDLKVTRPSDTSCSSEDPSDSERKSPPNDGCFIKTSKIVNIYEKAGTQKEDENDSTSHQLSRVHDKVGNFKISSQNIWDWQSSSNYCFSNETLIDQEFFLNHEDGLSLSASIKDEFCLSDAYALGVPTIPEENEDDLSDKTEDSRSDATSVSHSKCSEDNSTEVKHNIPRNYSMENIAAVSKSDQLPSEEQLLLPNESKCLDQNSEEEFLDLDRINYRRLRLLSDCFLDESQSRRNSWNDSDSNCDSDDESSS